MWIERSGVWFPSRRSKGQNTGKSKQTLTKLGAAMKNRRRSWQGEARFVSSLRGGD